ncbi:transcription factor UPBEAT1-like [Miscanthus floridulus]|uniref:transcription factor UPBEAT1-like n=1 Tax=Miscanthus floridulus TaxID=154761 RepID=UPI00345A14D5
MAAQSCCDAVAGTAAPAATRRLKLTRPLASLMKARKIRKKAAGGKRPRAAASRKRVMAIRRKMEALRRLVPLCGDDGRESGGDRLDELLLHAAGYILRLQMQLRVMQVMVHALNNLPED